MEIVNWVKIALCNLIMHVRCTSAREGTCGQARVCMIRPKDLITDHGSTECRFETWPSIEMTVVIAESVVAEMEDQKLLRGVERGSLRR